jgi:hypothetical protein
LLLYAMLNLLSGRSLLAGVPRCAFSLRPARVAPAAI